jgi:hypothetical protein
MLIKVKMKYFILIFILVLVIIQQNNQMKSECFVDNSKICILLTMCVNPVYTNHKLDNRKDIYINTINNYLKFTNLDLFIVESSEYTFPEFQNNPRVKVFSYKNNLKYSNSIYGNKHPSPLEANSIIKAIDYFNLNSYEYIIKITGRYFIPNIAQIRIPIGTDLIFQSKWNIFFQHSEIFGCKANLLKQLMEFIIKYSFILNFENCLMLFSYKYTYYRIPKIKLQECVKQGSTSRFICEL